MGMGLSGILDQIIPGADIDLNIEGPELETPTGLGRLLSCMRIRRVPILVVLVLFLLLFGITGLLIQDLILTLFGTLLPAAGASLLSFILTIPMVRSCAFALSRIIPHDESSAVSRDTLIGRTAQITLGSCKQGYPAQAKCKDRYGQMHYLMLEPDDSEAVFNQGEVILLVKHDGVRFYGIRPTSPGFENSQSLIP